LRLGSFIRDKSTQELEANLVDLLLKYGLGDVLSIEADMPEKQTKNCAAIPKTANVSHTTIHVVADIGNS